ncbi:glucose-1-phosphate cytidylyltransferase [Synergistales bacterium]|nr:glucose-1-phosphate cytidylyltransferase [Synergistales bacterium]
MQVVILAGGLGTRMTEETIIRPKPLVEVGGRPILWHIMKMYSHYGINDFIVCLGYKGYMIKEYFANYRLHMSNITFDMRDGSMEVHKNASEPWRVTLVDTGDDTATGGRLLRVKPYVNGTFCFTYGDGVADVRLDEEIAFHNQNKTFATMLAVQPPGRYGHAEISGDKVLRFQEKTRGDGGWINGGFFVLEPEVFDYIAGGDETPWETGPLERLASEGQLSAFKHSGFWRPMDTLRDNIYLNSLWDSKQAPWRIWDDAQSKS